MEKTLRFEQALLEEKSAKFEQLEKEIQEIELRHQKEMRSMQKEINKLQDDDQYKNLFNNITVADNLNTYTHRKMIKPERKSKVVSSKMNPGSINIPVSI